MDTFAHSLVFTSSSMTVRTLTCWSPRDPVGFEHQYAASRISLVRAGVFARVIAGCRVVADPTQALLVNRGDVHRFTYPLDGGNTCTVLEPSSATLAELCGTAGKTAARFPVHQRTISPRVAHLHDRLRFALASGRPCRWMVEELALDICGALIHGRPVGVLPRVRTELAETVRLILNARFSDPPSLGELARTVGRSPFEVSRIFRQHVGSTIRAYIGRLRAFEAARLLRAGATDIGMMALEIGYCDHAHLTRAFTRTWRCTPSEFRSKWAQVRSAGAARPALPLQPRRL